MKKTLALLLALAMVVSMVACSSTEVAKVEPPAATEEPAPAVVEEVEVPVEAPAEEEVPAEEAPAEEPAEEAAEEVTEEAEEIAEEPAEDIEVVPEEPIEDESDPAPMSYAEFMAAELESPVIVEAYVQQCAYAAAYGNASLFLQDDNGGYYVYRMNVTEEEAAALVPGQKIRVSGYKAEWSGEVEITDANFEFVNDGTTFTSVTDITALLGNESALLPFVNCKIAVKGLTVTASKAADGSDAAFLYNWDGSGAAGSNSDLYFNVSLNGAEFNFCVESDEIPEGSEAYTAVTGLQIGDVIDAEGFLYWYNGANPHITSVTVVTPAPAAEEPAAEAVVEEVVAAAETAVEEVVAVAEPVVEEVTEAAEAVAEEVKETAETAVEEVVEAAEPVVEEVAEAAEAVAEEVKETAETAVEEVVAAAEPVVEEVTEAAEEVKETVETAVEEVVAAAEPVVEEVTEAAETVAEEVKETAETAVEEVVAAAEPVVEEVTEAAETAVEEVVEAAEPIVEEVAEAAETVAEEVKETAETAVEEVVEAVEPVVEEAAATVEAVVEEVIEAAETAVEEVVEAAEPVVEEVAEAAETAVEEVVAAAEPVVEEVAEAAETAVEEVVEAAEPVVEEVIAAAEAVVEEVKEAAEEPAAEEPAAEEPAAEEPAAEEAPAVMTYAEYIAAELDTPVVIEGYIQQCSYAAAYGNASLYLADADGAYYVYRMNVTEEEAAKLTAGQKIKVSGFKSEWSGEVEIAEATFEIVEDAEPFTAPVNDLTAVWGDEEAMKACMNAKITVKGLTVTASKAADGSDAAFLYAWDGSGAAGANSDLYFNVELNGAVYNFCVESDEIPEGSEAYTAVTELQIGDVIDAEAFLYWYNGANPHVTAVTVVTPAPAAEEPAPEEAPAEPADAPAEPADAPAEPAL